MADDPEKDDPSGPAEPEGDDPSTPLPPRPRPRDLDDIEFAVKQAWERSPLVVTIADGPIASGYGPAELIGKLAERIAALIKDVAGSPPMLYGIAPTHSMTLFFGDPQPSGAQEQMAFEVTLDAARRVADLVEAEDDDFVKQAIRIGAPMRRYDDLAALVQSEGVNLKWQPLGETPRNLTYKRAGKQHVRLHAPPKTTHWDATINGYLYRVIAEPTDEEGTAGIRRFKWSPKPVGVKGSKVIASAERKLLDAALEAGLFGNEVEAVLRIYRGVPGDTIDPDYIRLEWRSIQPGPSEASRLGQPIDTILSELAGDDEDED